MHRRRVLADRITYVGLDVHKESIVVAMASGGLRGEVREFGRIANTATALDRLLRKLDGDSTKLWFCYEAAPRGYGIQRSAHRHECVLVAASLIPKRAGDRVKPDRPDAASLARLHREAAWGYRFPARLSHELLLRQENQPSRSDIGWKGQVRLCARYRWLARTGKPANIVTTAIARELSCFVWVIARQVMAAAG
jgi:hypothetical protein